MDVDVSKTDPRCEYQYIDPLQWNTDEGVLLRSKLREKIPYRIHQIWLGPENMKDEHSLNLAYWREFAIVKGYQYRLWTDIEDDLMLPQEKEHFETFLKIKDWWAAADILRYHILKKYGGLYVDVDFRPPRDHTGNYCDILEYTSKTGLVAFSEHDSRNLPGIGSYFLMNGMIACCLGHPIMVRLCEQISKNIETWKKNAGTVDASMCCGPFFFSRHMTGPFTMIPITFMKQFQMYD